ncbi:FAD-dependent monooxygenase [Uliginosibacterium gangwonense]|uniref:FAD-dependent monooxygenase n=1 Tax=Uliginosibacterium gangwonense TaxID=392736 RepID=UPI00035C5832|nr:FAD-dependent monooxygenase [Uliginosibacterium gangwonense]
MADIGIVGAGPLGLATALLLHRQGQAVRIFDARAADAPLTESRVLALSEGSRQILRSIDAWPERLCTPIRHIHVSQQGAPGRTLMDAAEHGLAALGYVLPARDLIVMLRRKVEAEGIPLHFASPVETLLPDAHGIVLRIAGEDRPQEHYCSLALCCEGSVRNAKDMLTHDYRQRALLCRASIAAPHNNLAYERFTPAGPVALLPLGQDYAVVWTRALDEADALLDAPDADWLAALQTHFGTRVRFTGISERASYPLALKMRVNTVGERTVWLGNAAQTLHPVAGQGLNLALRDAWELADALREASDPGAASVLRAYGRGRQLDRFAAAGFSDALIRTFGSSLPGLPFVRGLGLAALDALPPLRRFLARRMIYGARALP